MNKHIDSQLILVVEDDRPVRGLITTALEMHDYRFEAVDSGKTAVMNAASHNPDLIMLDLGLPDMDGIEVIEKIRSWSTVPIIVISARTEDADKITGYYWADPEGYGASYAVTQLFYDNKKYFQFVEMAREKGITIPIIPGIKPLAKRSQLTAVPKTFHCDLPLELSTEAARCTTDEEVRQLGIEWAVNQCRELMAAGVPSLHFYTVSAVESIREIARQIY